MDTNHTLVPPLMPAAKLDPILYMVTRKGAKSDSRKRQRLGERERERERGEREREERERERERERQRERERGERERERQRVRECSACVYVCMYGNPLGTNLDHVIAHVCLCVDADGSRKPCKYR